VEPGAEWSGALSALHTWLEQDRDTLKNLDIVLSDRFHRFAMIPWSDSLQGRAELEALSRAHFEAMFGEVADDWEIATEFGSYGRPGVGCAIDKELLGRLRETVGAAGARITSLQPHFVRAFNQVHREIGVAPALLLVVAEGNCVLAGFRDGSWHSVRSMRLTSDEEPKLAMLIHRERLLQGLDEDAQVLILGAGENERQSLQRLRNVKVIDSTADTARKSMPASLAEV
jgi:hypothetical protein